MTSSNYDFIGNLDSSIFEAPELIDTMPEIANAGGLLQEEINAETARAILGNDFKPNMKYHICWLPEKIVVSMFDTTLSPEDDDYVTEVILSPEGGDVKRVLEDNMKTRKSFTYPEKTEVGKAVNPMYIMGAFMIVLLVIGVLLLTAIS